MASRSMLLFLLAAAVLAVSSYADQDHQFISQEAVSSTKYVKSPPPPAAPSPPLVKPAPTPAPPPSPAAKPSPPPLVKPAPSPSAPPPQPPPYKKPPTPSPAPTVPKPPTPSPAPVPVPKPPTAAPPPPSPFVKSIKDCAPLCLGRCKLHSRPNRCNRACNSCCSKCKCVPPGTYGNREVCGTCYTGLTTKFDKPKCP